MGPRWSSVVSMVLVIMSMMVVVFTSAAAVKLPPGDIRAGCDDSEAVPYGEDSEAQEKSNDDFELMASAEPSDEIEDESPEPSMSDESENEDEMDEQDTTSTPSASPSITPTTGTRTYPCREGFTLQKEYTSFPNFVYYCVRSARFAATLTDVSCLDGYFRRLDQCVKSTPECAATYTSNPACFLAACGAAEFRIINERAQCIVCPASFLVYLEDEKYMCFKRIKQPPACPPGQSFDRNLGSCQPF